MDGYLRVTACMGMRLRGALERVGIEERHRIREIRLRQGQPVALTMAEGVRFLLPEGRLSELDGPRVLRAAQEDISDAFRRACGYSVHSWEEEAARGFLTLEGGHRVGVAGTASAEGGRVCSLRQVGSLNFRIARNVSGAAGDLPQRLYSGRLIPSVLIAGEPGSGKTTFLRDLVRRLSSGETGRYFSSAVIDERCELSGSRDGKAVLDLGACTDLLCGYPKAEGMSIALRTMTPDLLVCDEIGGEAEAAAAADSIQAGTALLCSAHAGDLQQLQKRRSLHTLLECGVFDYLVLLASRETPCEVCEILPLEAMK